MTMDAEALDRIASGPFAGYLRNYYKVLYVDPPWQFHAWSHRGEGKGASQHYNCMALDDLCDLPVRDIAADDAVLFLWVGQPMLPEAMEVLKAWGFTFKTVGFIWVKMSKSWNEDQMSFMLPSERPRLGLGYHSRSGAEQCWIAVRGKGYDRVEKGIEQVLHAPLQEHSRKPEEIARRIERLTGNVPRIELFARRALSGWACWGNEAPKGY